PSLGFEWIPGSFTESQYRVLSEAWSPLGRTDLYEIKDSEARTKLYEAFHGTFQINTKSIPEYSFFTTNFRAGTPVYHLDDPASVRPNVLTQPMEFPYSIYSSPEVFVIGVGGGRDLVMAHFNGAKRIVGAEINPATYRMMARNGIAYEYSGKIFDWPGVSVFNIDGRHLVMNQPRASYDLIIINGVDTFAALSSGAYSFAENYIYTKEAIIDYLRILKANGSINFNRWFEQKNPRETLRLFVMIMDAMSSEKIQEPWKNIVLAEYANWGMILAKKQAFAPTELEKLKNYFAKVGARPHYMPDDILSLQTTEYHRFIEYFKRGQSNSFINSYWADIEPVTDDSPFFYKYYRVSVPGKTFHPSGGSLAFYIQLLLIYMSSCFILIFVLMPLALFGKRTLWSRSIRICAPFVGYFACLGCGFIFIEIALMQRLSLWLGSPLHALPVTLGSLLVFSGMGSLYSGTASKGRKIIWPVLMILISLLCFIFLSTYFANFIVTKSMWERILFSIICIGPLGIALGYFFPTALRLVAQYDQTMVPWAWGINAAFTVLGSIVAVIIAQFSGISTLFGIAGISYVLAASLLFLLKKQLLGSQSPSFSPYFSRGPLGLSTGIALVTLFLVGGAIGLQQLYKFYTLEFEKGYAPYGVAAISPDRLELIKEGVNGFNILLFKGTYIAFPQSAGAFQKDKWLKKTYPQYMTGDTVDEVLVKLNSLPQGSK
ncbi:MAG: hypothetical protein HY537_18500, partial [Deltaproteobacteria bacterium]|nr:hypothetical protein [Deltaproteobacteria bacterium]